MAQKHLIISRYYLAAVQKNERFNEMHLHLFFLLVEHTKLGFLFVIKHSRKKSIYTENL